MIQCELCRGFFHTSCVSVPNVLQGPRVWLCPHCHRSEKPPLEKILPLLASLQRIRVRLPEGDALRYMIERTVNWQHRAQQMLYSGNLKHIQDKVGSGLLYTRWQATSGQLPETNKVRLSCWWVSWRWVMCGQQKWSIIALWVLVHCICMQMPAQQTARVLLYRLRSSGSALTFIQDMCVLQQQLHVFLLLESWEQLLLASPFSLLLLPSPVL